MSSNPVVRQLRLPPTNLGEQKIPKTRFPARHWYRVHLTQQAAIYFSIHIHHRFSHPNSPYPFLYLGSDPDTCLFERFGSLMYNQQMALPAALWNANSISTIRVPDLHVCDLTNAKTLSALTVDLSSLMHNDVRTPQQWGLAIQQHPAQFQAIRFESRFNGKACLALFKRDAIDVSLAEVHDQALPGDSDAVEWLHKHKVSLY